MKQKVGIVDVDGGKRFPNLALMKISAWHKSHGDSVEWLDPMFGGHYDVAYLSKVFSFTPDVDYYIDADSVVKGGTGYCIDLVDGKEVFHPERDTHLPDEIEHTYPDYSLYPTLTEDTAYGFLTRGCPRGCDFCIVGKKEGRCSRKVADLEEFWRGQRNIVLCDPNILACREWPDLLRQLAESGAWVDFNQGLDIRLMDEARAEALKAVRIKEIHFAWDRYSDRDRVLPKLRLYARVCGKKLHGHNAIVYTLVNHSSTLEEDLDRIYTLRGLGYWPYVMVYDKAHADPVYRRLSGWVNNRFIFAKCERFEDYRTSHR